MSKDDVLDEQLRNQDWIAGGQRPRPQWERDLPDEERAALDRGRAQAAHFHSYTAMHGDGRDRTLLRIEAKLDELLRRLPPPPIDQR